MRLLRWVAIGMTTSVIVGTVWEAAVGHRVGLIVFGLLVSWFGIIVLALTDPDRER